jgi:hypothetical protein
MKIETLIVILEHKLIKPITTQQGSTLTVADCPGQVKCVFGQVKTAPNLSDGASENYSVICSIPEEQND